MKIGQRFLLLFVLAAAGAAAAEGAGGSDASNTAAGFWRPSRHGQAMLPSRVPGTAHGTTVCSFHNFIPPIYKFRAEKKSCEAYQAAIPKEFKLPPSFVSTQKGASVVGLSPYAVPSVFVLDCRP
jgi:hypothetical protein